jgi:hypothetical protein
MSIGDSLTQLLHGGYNVCVGSRSLYTAGFNFSYATSIGYSIDLEDYPATAPTVALAGSGAGNVDNGVHRYKVTYVLDIGETEISTAYNSVTVADNTADGQVALTSIPTYTGGYTCTARKLYRTKATGTNPTLDYYLLDTIADNTTTTYNDNKADSTITTLQVSPSGWLALGSYAKITASTAGKRPLVLGGLSGGIAFLSEIFFNGQTCGGTGANYPIIINGNISKGTNAAGGDITIAGGRGTGTAVGGAVYLATSSAGSTGTTLNALVNRVKISYLGLDLPVAGERIAIKEGSNASLGTAVLVAGTATVNNTLVTANSRIFLTAQAAGGTPGAVYVSARTAGTSFAITSTSGTDTSTVAYLIIEPL